MNLADTGMPRLSVVVTTSQSGRADDIPAAFLAETGWPLVARGRRSLARVQEEAGADAVAVWMPQGPRLFVDGEVFYFHPSMAKNRLSRHRKGLAVDVLQRVAGIRPGDQVLDCTLGLGADAIVASWLAGAGGRVVGLEASPEVAAIVRWGMRCYHSGISWLDEAIWRIEVLCAHHLQYLRALPAASFDVVLFDPMFRQPVHASRPLTPLRRLAQGGPLEREAVEAARRVARRRVVLKERRHSPEFARLGFARVEGGESSRVAYG
ncbi:MAG: class I SAM-dependent methyltransferase, partial [Syntrophomonadaceae bacterium]|nr:class I SAM-dependent methyltransferase [Syntrophomonadaceae bacterium]